MPETVPEVEGKPQPVGHLDTPEDDLAGRGIRSGFARVVAQGASVVLGVGSTMILARLLTPEDFGLLAMVGSLLAFVGSFRDFGFPMATMHREALSQRDASALFWLSLKLNGGVFLLMVVMAPVLAAFYGRSELTLITLVMACSVFVTGAATQHEALLMRAMRFEVQTTIEVAALACGVVAALVAAVMGMGYWALVLQLVVLSLVRAGALWAVSGWRPTRGVAADEVRDMLQYSGHVTASRVVAHVGRNLDRVLVGYFGGATVLGLYEAAYKRSLFPLQQLHTPLLSVAVSGLSRVRDDPRAYRAFFRKGLQPVFALTTPALAFMAVEAEAVILFLLGSQWTEAVPLLRVLALAAIANSVIYVTKTLFLAEGHTERQLRWNLLSAPLMVLAVAVGIRWGAMGVAVGFALGSILLVYPSLAYCLRTSAVTFRDVWWFAGRSALAAAGAVVVLLAVRSALPDLGAVGTLLLHGCVFGVSYVAWWAVLPGRREATADIVRLLRRLRNSRGE